MKFLEISHAQKNLKEFTKNLGVKGIKRPGHITRNYGSME